MSDKTIFDRLKRVLEFLESQVDNSKKSGLMFLPSSNERAWFERFLEEYNALEKKEAYQELVKNLDSESTSLIAQTISRIEKVVLSREPVYFFSPKEEADIGEMNQRFFPEILKIEENCYVYDNIFMTTATFSPHLFYYQMELGKFDYPERFANSNIIDAGCCMGDSSLILSKWTSKKVFAFDPISTNYQLLLDNIELNNVDNIIPEKIGLGEFNEEVQMYVAGGSSSVNIEPVWHEYEKEQVRIVSLDSYVKENSIENVGLIKVDIEGFEQPFLRGAKEVIARDKPSMLISLYHSANDFFQIKPLIESWGLGYKFKLAKPNDGRLLMETVLLAEVEK